MDLEKTLGLIKPDAVRAGKAEEIKQLVELHGFTIIAEQKLQLTKARAEEFYAEHHGKPFFTRLVDFMTSGPVWAMVLAKPDAIKGWRSLMGPTNVFTAREQAPRSLRALYGTDGTQNACHGSDSPASAEREIKFYFPNLVLEPLLDSEDCQQYITDKIQPALGAALAELARQKPSAEKFEAITFLADYLLNNNPNKPKIVLPDEWDPSADAAHHIEASSDDEDLFAQAQARAQATAVPDMDALVPAAAAQAMLAAPSQPVVSRSVSAGSANDVVGGAADAASATAQTAAATSRPASSASAGSVAAQAMALASDTVAATAVLDEVSAPEDMQSTQGAAATADVGAEAADTAADADAAATKVQAAFRGYQARKQVADLRRGGNVAAAVEEQAATTQQADDITNDASQLNAPVTVDSGVGRLDEDMTSVEPTTDAVLAAASSSQHGSQAASRPASAAVTPQLLPSDSSKSNTPTAAEPASEESAADAAEQKVGAVTEQNAADVASETEHAPADVAAESAAPADAVNALQPVAADEPDQEPSEPAAVASEQSDAEPPAADAAVEEPPAADAAAVEPQQTAAADDITLESSSATPEVAAHEVTDSADVPAVSSQAGLTVLEATFARLDQDSSGHIDKEEFKAALAKLGTLKEELNERAARLVQAMDNNGDKLVSRAEFISHLSWLQDVLAEPELMQFLEASFQSSGSTGAAVPAGADTSEGQQSRAEQEPAAVQDVAQAGDSQQNAEEYNAEQVAAVTRIQAAGRGMLDRKRVAALKQHETTTNAAGSVADGVAEGAAVDNSGQYTPEASQAVLGEGNSGEYTPDEASQAVIGEGSEETHTTEQADEQ